MATFTLSGIESLEYDFREFKKADGTNCTGHGVIPEPSGEQLDAFIRAMVAIGNDAEAKADSGDEGNFSLAEVRKRMIDAVASLGVDRAHLEELPLRAVQPFAMWLQSELFTGGADA